MLKVLDSGSTSESDERHYEPSVCLKNAAAPLHKKQKHTETTNRMLKGYAEQKQVSEVDTRLLVGVVSKVPLQDKPKPAQVVQMKSAAIELGQTELEPDPNSHFSCLIPERAVPKPGRNMGKSQRSQS